MNGVEGLDCCYRGSTSIACAPAHVFTHPVPCFVICNCVGVIVPVPGICHCEYL